MGSGWHLPEPLMSDEQPGSWGFYEADLHTDRLSGNHQREVAKGYRDQYCPNDAVPGFAFHQTDRDATGKQKQICPDGRCSNYSRARDFDLLGYRYSLLSSIGTAGLNNVINMLPARDEQEFSLFPKQDLEFIKRWMSWTDANVDLLKLTRPVPTLSTPARGQVDGTIMLRADNSGVMFLYNPTMREKSVSLPLSGLASASLGFVCRDDTKPVVVHQLETSESTSVAYDLDVLECHDVLNVTVAATTALVLGFAQWEGAPPQRVLGSPFSEVSVDESGALKVNGAMGEAGTSAKITVVLSPGTPDITSMQINGKTVTRFERESLFGLPTIKVSGSWAGVRFSRAAEIKMSEGTAVEFVVPHAAFDQLRHRNATYPIEYCTDPEATDEANVPWLAPGRLLVFVKYSPVLSDALDISGEIDGQPLLMRKAYNTIVPNSGRFIGHWADVTPLVVPGTSQRLKLNLPEEAGQPNGIFFENVETILTEVFEQGDTIAFI